MFFVAAHWWFLVHVVPLSRLHNFLGAENRKELRCTFMVIECVFWFLSSQHVIHTKHSRNALSILQKETGIYICDRFLLFYVVCADMMCGIVFHSCVVHSELKVHDAMPSFNNKSDGYFAEVHYTLYGLPFYYIFLHALVIATLPFL